MDRPKQGADGNVFDREVQRSVEAHPPLKGKGAAPTLVKHGKGAPPAWFYLPWWLALAFTLGCQVALHTYDTFEFECEKFVLPDPSIWIGDIQQNVNLPMPSEVKAQVRTLFDTIYSNLPPEGSFEDHASKVQSEIERLIICVHETTDAQ